MGVTFPHYGSYIPQLCELHSPTMGVTFPYIPHAHCAPYAACSAPSIVVPTNYALGSCGRNVTRPAWAVRGAIGRVIEGLVCIYIPDAASA